MLQKHIAAAGISLALILGAGTGVAIGLDGGGEEPVVNKEPSTTASLAPTTTLAPGFEGYKPGGTLPTPAPAPKRGEAVTTVPGPYGPIYPDGYQAPKDPAASSTTRPFDPKAPGPG